MTWKGGCEWTVWWGESLIDPSGLREAGRNDGRWSLTYNGSASDVSTLWWCRNNAYSVEASNFDLFLDSDELYHNTLLWCWIVVATTAPKSAMWSGSKQVHLQPLCTQITSVFFPFSIVFSGLHDIFKHSIICFRLCVRWFCPAMCLFKCCEHV